MEDMLQHFDTSEKEKPWDAPEVPKVTTCFVLFAIIIIFGYLFR